MAEFAKLVLQETRPGEWANLFPKLQAVGLVEPDSVLPRNSGGIWYLPLYRAEQVFEATRRALKNQPLRILMEWPRVWTPPHRYPEEIPV